MAVDIRTNVVENKRQPSKFGRLMQTLVFRVRDEALVPRGYYQVPLVQNQAVYLGDICNQNTGTGDFPEDANIFVINVEAGRVRYSDSDTAGSTWGELWPAGSAFTRALRNLRMISVCSPDAGTILNVSLYTSRNV